MENKAVDAHPICLNLDKALQITNLLTNFSDDEVNNIKVLIKNIYNICRCDAIAFIQKKNLLKTNTNVLAPLEKTNDRLTQNYNYKDILDYAEQHIEKSEILYKHDSVREILDYDSKSFVVISNVVLDGKFIGCLLALYLKDSLGYKLFSEIDTHYYQLASNIIASQIKCFLIKNKVNKIHTFRKNLNELSSLLYKTPASEMIEYINKCLKITCQLWNIDRGYLYVVDYETKKLLKINEWCAPGVEALIDSEYEFSIDDFPWNHILYQFTENISPIHIANIEDELEVLTKAAEYEKNSDLYKTIKEQIKYLREIKKIKSILLIPIIDNFKDTNFTIGVLGFSQVFEYTYFKEDLIDTLTVLSCYIAEAVKRWKTYKIKDINSKYFFNKLLEWQYDNQEYNKKYKVLKTKMDSILDKYTSMKNGDNNV